MKDTDARQDVADLWKRVRALEDKLTEQVACPTCDHVTLMKWHEGAIYYQQQGDDSAQWVRAPDTYYCYTCGKTFKESTKTELVEVTA